MIKLGDIYGKMCMESVEDTLVNNSNNLEVVKRLLPAYKILTNIGLEQRKIHINSTIKLTLSMYFTYLIMRRQERISRLQRDFKTTKDTAISISNDIENMTNNFK